MTDFVARDTTHLGVDRIATSPTAFALYENLFAFAGKATGAPVLANSYVVEAMIAASAVSEGKVAAAAISQGKLKSTTGDVSTGSTSMTNLTLPGGEYGFYPLVWTDAGNSTSAEISTDLLGTSPVTNIALSEPSNSGGQARARQRYIQASPPYDLGNGAVPLFVFALMDASGNILATYAAEDPPWANNGPTSIRPDGHLPDGTPVKLERARPSLSALRNPLTRAAELAKLEAAPKLVRITQAVKQADMPLIPHPFLCNDLTGKTVVLLDPVSDIVHRLHELQRSGESLPEVLHGGYLNIGNLPLSLQSPPGVLPVACSWK